MTIAKLIPETVAKLTQPDLYWDETLKGFGLNVRRDARGNIQRSWIIQYRIGKQQRKLKLGDAAKLNAKQARKKADELFAQITLGQDPQGEKKAARAAERAGPTLTLRSALDKYIEMKEAEVREGTYRENSLKITRLYLLALSISARCTRSTSTLSRGRPSPGGYMRSGRRAATSPQAAHGRSLRRPSPD